MNMTTKRWIAGFVMAAGLGGSLFAGSAVATADSAAATNNDVSGAAGGATVGPVDDGVSTRNLQEQVGVPIRKKGIGDIFSVSPNISRAGAQIVDVHCAQNTGCPPK